MANLFSKLTNLPLEYLPKGIRATNKACSYNFVKGTGKKGDFEIYSFFDKNGKLIKRNTTYFKEGNTSNEIRWYNPKEIRTVKSLNGKPQEFATRKLYNNCFIETQILPKKGYDIHRFVKLKAGHKPKEINYKTLWDGNKPQINYINCNRILDNVDGTEYIPVITAENSTKSINHIFYSQAKSQGLEGIIPPIRVISRDEAYQISSDLKKYEKTLHKEEKIPGFCDESGQVYFLNNIKGIDTKIDTISHEVQHAKDRSDFARLEHNSFYISNDEFTNKSRAKGIIKEAQNPEEYQRLSELENSYNAPNYLTECINGKHDTALCEKGAIEKGQNEFNKALNAFIQLNNFLFGP